MQWEQLSAPEFKKAVENTKVCILPMGVVESHHDHLPLGTDFLNCHRIASLAAEIEPAVVFPCYYFGQVYEAGCYPGSIAIKPGILLELLFCVLDSIGSNGFNKIIIYNGHGGNGHFLHFVAQCSLWEEKPYHVYLYEGAAETEASASFKEICESGLHGHACECETSITMYNFPELVKTEEIPEKSSFPLNRMKSVPNTYAGIWWYADYPEYYAGEPVYASRAKGEALMKLYVEAFARYIASVKKDDTVPSLTMEFFRRKGTTF